MAHSITGASLEGIQSQLNQVGNEHPLTANTFADWSMQAGDVVTITRGTESYSSTVHNMKTVWTGAPRATISNTGNRERASVAAVSRDKFRHGGTAVRANEGIHSYVWNTESTIYSYVDQTATYIVQGVENVESRLGSQILQTAEEIRSEVHAADSQLYSYVDQTATYISSHVEDVANDLGSEILQTASEIRAEVHAANSTLYSYVDQTATSITAHVEDVANDLGSEILQTASQIRAEVHAANSELYSYVDQTATSITSHVEDVANDLGSEILQTASQIRAEVHAANSELYSYVDQTATSITSHVEDVANDLGSEILQTASQIRAEVHAADSTLYSYVDQTATSIHSEVQSVESGMYSYVDQTASGIRQEVSNTAAGLQSSITTQANRISLVVNGTGSNASIKAAQIVAAINDDGTSQTLISANKILLDGNTTVAGLLSVEDGGLKVTGNTFFNGNVTMASGKEIVAGDIRATGVRFPGVNPGDDRTLTLSDVTGMIVKAEVDSNTNTLKLWKKGDAAGSPSITFSKAASITGMTGSWSGSTLTVVTNPSTGYEYTVGFGSQTANQKLAVDIDRTNPPEIITGTTNLRVPLHVYTPGTSQSDPNVDRYTTTASLSMAPLLEDKTSTNKITANGTYSPASGHIGFSAVEVNVPSSTITPVLTGGWNGTTFTVSSTPQSTGDKGTTISSKYSYDNSTGVHYIDVDAQDTGAQQPTTRARYTLGLSTGSVSSGSRTITVQYKGSNTSLSYSCPDYGNGLDTGYQRGRDFQDKDTGANLTTSNIIIIGDESNNKVTSRTLDYGEELSVWPQVLKYGKTEGSTTNSDYRFGSNVKITAPAFPTVSNWSLGTYTAPYTYKPTVKVGGTTYTSGSLNATQAYDAGWSAGQSTSTSGKLELYRTPTGNIAYGTTYTIKAKAYSSRDAQAKTDISGASITITTPADRYSEGLATGKDIGYERGRDFLDKDTAASLTTANIIIIGDQSNNKITSRTLSYGEELSVWPQVLKYGKSEGSTNNDDYRFGSNVKITAPAFPTVSNWSLGTYTAPYTYRPTVKVGGTTYTSGALNAVQAYSAGWTSGQSTSSGGQLELYRAPTGNIAYGTTYTIKAKAYSSKDAQAKTDISGASITITTPADRYNDGRIAGWNAYLNKTWYTPSDTPPSGYAAGHFWIPTSQGSAWSDNPGYYNYAGWDTKWNNAVNNGKVDGWNTYYDKTWYTPADTPPSGYEAGHFWFPARHGATWSTDPGYYNYAGWDTKWNNAVNTAYQRGRDLQNKDTGANLTTTNILFLGYADNTKVTSKTLDYGEVLSVWPQLLKNGKTEGSTTGSDYRFGSNIRITAPANNISTGYERGRNFQNMDTGASLTTTNIIIIGDVDNNKITSRTLDFGETLGIWPQVLKNGRTEGSTSNDDYRFGGKVTIKAPSVTDITASYTGDSDPAQHPRYYTKTSGSGTSANLSMQLLLSAHGYSETGTFSLPVTYAYRDGYQDGLNGASYTMTFKDTGRVSSGSISSIISGYDSKLISGVKDSANQEYRYIRFTVGGKKKCFYFS